MGPKMNAQERWGVLVVGNNPIELSEVFDRLCGISHKTILPEMAFDLRSVLHRLEHFIPQHILIDDNIGERAFHVLLDTLHKRRTRHVPVTVLKSSNYHQTAGTGVVNYVLKQNLTSELLYRELLNSLHFLKTQRYWNQTYRRRKGQLARLFKRSTTQI